MKPVNAASLSPIFVVIGLNHHQCPVDVRELCNKWGAERTDLCSTLSREVGFAEVMVIATCNRFEIVGVVASAGGIECSPEESADSAEEVIDRCRQYLSREVSEKIETHLFSLEGERAIRHFFRVTSSLDSLVVGEGQITGQVKAAYAQAQLLGTSGKHLHRLAQCALNVSKKVKANTRIAEKAVSVSYIAIKLAEQIFGDLADCNVLVLGSGRMAELAVLHLAKRGCGSIVVANRTEEKATELASRVGGIGISLNEASLYLHKADFVIGSVTTDKPLLEVAMVRKLKRARPLFLIDLGMPRNFPQALSSIDGVYLYNVDDLASIVDENKQIREDAANDAEVIVEYGLHQFGLWLERLQREPETLSLRSQIQLICQGELERAMPGLRFEDPMLLESLIDRISGKVAHVTQQALQHRVGSRNGWSLPEHFESSLQNAITVEPSGSGSTQFLVTDPSENEATGWEFA
jgi:glutamyl-tRNA reductase